MSMRDLVFMALGGFGVSALIFILALCQAAGKPLPVPEDREFVEPAKTGMAIIHWRTPSGFEGHGQPVSVEVAKAWLSENNGKYPQLTRWLEFVPVKE